jgi:hypothetical protein
MVDEEEESYQSDFALNMLWAPKVSSIKARLHDGTMVLSKSHGKSAIYPRCPTDFLWDLLRTIGYPTV